MKLIEVITGRTKGGKFKAYFWGDADMHISNWRGCNYRTRAVPGQPLRGYNTREEAERFAARKFIYFDQARNLAGRIGDGTHLSDARYKAMDVKGVELKKAPLPLPGDPPPAGGYKHIEL